MMRSLERHLYSQATETKNNPVRRDIQQLIVMTDERISIGNSMITSGIYAKYLVQIMLLFVYTTTRKRFVIFTCRYFKLN